jgi:hypothetical protein
MRMTASPRCFWLISIVGVLLLLSARVSAQSARAVTFTASPDHSVIAQGVAVVDRYELVVAPQGGQPLAPFNLQKPTPNTSNVITVTLTTYLNTLPAGTYTGIVQAVGPGGSAVSPASPPFSLVVPRPGAPGTPAFSSGGGS